MRWWHRQSLSEGVKVESWQSVRWLPPVWWWCICLSLQYGKCWHLYFPPNTKLCLYNTFIFIWLSLASIMLTGKMKHIFSDYFTQNRNAKLYSGSLQSRAVWFKKIQSCFPTKIASTRFWMFYSLHLSSYKLCPILALYHSKTNIENI